MSPALPLGATRVIVAQLMSVQVLRAHETMTSDLANDIRFMRRLRDLVLDS